jgi:hypothetical protein
MLAKINEATVDCGNKGFVTRFTLRKALPTPAWQPLEEPESMLSKILTSSVFKSDA